MKLTQRYFVLQKRTGFKGHLKRIGKLILCSLKDSWTCTGNPRSAMVNWSMIYGSLEPNMYALPLPYLYFTKKQNHSAGFSVFFQEA